MLHADPVSPSPNDPAPSPPPLVPLSPQSRRSVHNTHHTRAQPPPLSPGVRQPQGSLPCTRAGLCSGPAPCPLPCFPALGAQPSAFTLPCSLPGTCCPLPPGDLLFPSSQPDCHLWVWPLTPPATTLLEFCAEHRLLFLVPLFLIPWPCPSPGRKLWGSRGLTGLFFPVTAPHAPEQHQRPGRSCRETPWAGENVGGDAQAPFGSHRVTGEGPSPNCFLTLCCLLCARG